MSMRVRKLPEKLCPVCGDTSWSCEHVCYGCDVIVEMGTCTNGFCEDCCIENDCDGVNEEETSD